MKLSLLVTVAVTLSLRVNPVFSQEDPTPPEGDPSLQPAPEGDPAAQPIPEGDQAVQPIPEGDPAVEPVPEVLDEPVHEEGSDNEFIGEGDYFNVIPHIPQNCSDVRVFSARGSDEPYPGRGGAMLGVMCSLFEAANVSCDYEDIVYPANISFSGNYCISANIGAFAGQSQMTEYVQRCPDSRLVLMGYSQGGSVVADMLGGGGGPLFGCEQPFNPPLSRRTAPGSSVAALVTFGAPRFTANQSYNIGRGSTYNGVLGRQGQQLSDLNEYDDVVAMWCNAGDPVCAVGSDPVNITAHWSYYEEYSEVASRWIVATALKQTDVQLDLDLDGQQESVVLVHSNSSSDESDDQPPQEDGAFSMRSKSTGESGVLGLVVLVTAGIVTLL